MDSSQKISAGILTTFGVILVLVGLIGSVYLTTYINSITLGSVFRTAQDTNETKKVTGITFTGRNDTVFSLGHPLIIPSTLVIYNISNEFTFSSANFSINYSLGSAQIVNAIGQGLHDVDNGSSLAANYSYADVTTSGLLITNGALNFLADTEDSFFTVNSSVLSGLKFAASLIPIFVILAVLGGVLLGGRWAYNKYFKKEGGDGDMGY